MPLLVSGFPEKESRAKAIEALGLVGLSDRANHYPAQMSGRGSSNGSRLPGRSSTARKSCGPMSPQATWIAKTLKM